jgi:hypothetical protein
MYNPNISRLEEAFNDFAEDLKMNPIHSLAAKKDVAPQKQAPKTTVNTLVRYWMRGRSANDLPPQSLVDANQSTSLSAMIAYTAAQSGQSEFHIERMLADHFNVPNAKMLPAKQFDHALQYLADGFAA